MPRITWINLVNGVPLVRDFTTTGGLGTPICIDSTTDKAYFLDVGNVVTEIGSSPAGGVQNYNTRGGIEAIAAPVNNQTVYLTEAGREGVFVFDSANLSSKVTADTTQGIYIAPASAPTGASGAWVRVIAGPIDPMWFGVINGSASGANGAANSISKDAMLATLRARAVNIETNYQGLETIRFSPGYFEFDSTIELTNGSAIIEGADVARPGGHSTKLKFSTGVTGIRVQAYNTSGATGPADVPTHRGGQSIIRNLALYGAYVAPTEAEAYGIQLRGQGNIENIFIDLFEGDGIFIDATSGGATNEGNANVSYIKGCRVQRNRTGIYLNGADANIMSIIGCDFSSNRTWGAYDTSFLGNTYLGCHFATNGWVAGTTPTACSYLGNRYAIAVGQAVGASTNAPSGTTADNTWWLYIGAGGVNLTFNVIAWVSGLTWREGGCFKTDGSSARNCFFGCYTESDQNQAQLVNPTMVIGGLQGADIKGTAAYMRFVDNTSRAIGADVFRTLYNNGTSTFTNQFSEANLQTILRINDTVAAASSWRLKLNGMDVQWDYAASNSNRVFLISGPVTTQQFGTGAAVPHAFWAPRLMVGDASSPANGRMMQNGTVVPASGTHGAGEITWNRTPAVGGIAGWICRTTGTPGTWEALGIVGAIRSTAPTTTYVAPAGGTTIDTEGRASLAQLAADLADLKTKLATANLTA